MGQDLFQKKFLTEIKGLDLEKEKVYLNALNLIFQLKFLNLLKFLKEYSSFSLAFNDLVKKEKIKINPFKEWQKLKKEKIEFIPFWEKNYPLNLKEIPNFPLGIYFKSKVFSKNNLQELFSHFKTLAIVGTRKSTNYGEKITEKIINELKPFNFLIISGLAYGIDSLVHKICLKNDIFNFAVLASGLNKITPNYNYQLAQKIINKGGLISEYPLNTPSLKQYFPLRNRIISGLSLGVLVIEAPLKSGALITAHFALEQNREVFAIPGSIFNQNSSGCHLLIKSGAKLVEKAQDILEELFWSYPHIESLKEKHFLKINLNEKEKQILNIFNFKESLTLEEILEKANLKAEETLSILTELELKDLIRENQGYYFKNFS